MSRRNRALDLKFICTSVCLLLFALPSFSQLGVPNPKTRPIYTKHVPFHVDQLKGMTTYFIVPDSFQQMVYDRLEKEISSIWKLGKIRFMRAAKAKKKTFILGKTSFIRLTGYVLKTNLNVTTDYSYYLEYIVKRKEAAYNTILARVNLYPSTLELLKETNRYSAIKVKELSKVCSDPRRINNWSIGNIKNCLVYAQEKILKEQMFNGNKYVTKDRKEIAKLKAKGLSIPDYVLINNSTLHKRGKLDKEKVFASFSLPYELKKNERIDKEILGATDDYYYMSVVCGRLTTEYTIWNAYTNEIVVSLIKSGHSVKNSHLKKISKLIK